MKKISKMGFGDRQYHENNTISWKIPTQGHETIGLHFEGFQITKLDLVEEEGRDCKEKLG